MRPVRVLIVVTLVVVLIPILMGLGTTGGGATTVNPNTSYQLVDGTIANVPNTVDVSATTETALALNGSTTVALSGPTIPTTAWTVCSVAALDGSADQGAGYSLAAYQNESITLSYQNGNWTAYHNMSTGDALVRVSDADPTDLTPVCARYNSTGLSLYANGSWAGPATPDTATETRQVTWNWTGTIDETRVYGADLNDSEIRAYGADPAEPRDGAPRLARLMYDEGSGATTEAYFASASAATIANPGWTTGVADPQLDRGSDYELRGDPFEVRFPTSGYFDGAPVAYLSWSNASVMPIDFGSLFGLFAALLALVYLGNRLELI